MSLPIKIELPEHFLESEVRCGYEVSEKLKKIWAVELDLLKQLLDVCKKHDINVQVFAGTLLGAVRHNGFIPWDDDVDVAMTREDFNKLCIVAPQEFCYPYFFQTGLSDQKYFLGYGRLRNSLTTGIIRGNETMEYNNGIYIDVFALDGMTDCKILEAIQAFFIRILIKICTAYQMTGKLGYSFNDLILRVLRPFVRVVSYPRWVSIYNWVISLLTNMSCRIGLRTHLQYGDRYWILKSELEEMTELCFENILVPAPKAYELILSRTYGDYMTFPPAEQRGKWHEGQIRFEPDMPYKEFLKSKRM